MIFAKRLRSTRKGCSPWCKDTPALRLRPCADPGGTSEDDLVFDPFCGSGTTAVAAKELDRFFVGAELEEEFCKLTERRIRASVRGGVLREISG